MRKRVWLLAVAAAGILVVAGLVLYLQTPVKPPKLPIPEKITIPVQPLKIKAVAIIIDDVGHNHPAAKPFIEMDHPVALSILPNRPFSKELASEAFQKGKTILLHLPMQPTGYPEVDPGQGAILLSYTEDEIRKILEQDVADLPGIAGINNHMGSLATTDPRVMGDVLKFASEKGLFFVDSRTTPKSVALKLARQMNVPSAERNVFLDNERTPSAIDARTDELLDLADERGWAIGIGHPNMETARALERMARKASERNIQWISLESLIAYVNAGN